VPKPVSKELSEGEDFLGRVMSLDDLVLRLGDTSNSSRLAMVQQRVKDDLWTYSHIAQGQGTDAQGQPLTNTQMQDAAWMQSGATQAQVLIHGFAHALSNAPISLDAQKVRSDIAGDGTGLNPGQVIDDVQTFLKDLEVAAAPVNRLITLRESDGGPLTPKSGAGALLLYLGPVMKELNPAMDRVSAFLDPISTPRLNGELTTVSREQALVGKDGSDGTCLGTL